LGRPPAVGATGAFVLSHIGDLNGYGCKVRAWSSSREGLWERGNFEAEARFLSPRLIGLCSHACGRASTPESAQQGSHGSAESLHCRTHSSLGYLEVSSTADPLAVMVRQKMSN
jgi:hypothetical protein